MRRLAAEHRAGWRSRSTPSASRRTLEKAGFSRDQALGMARAIRDHASETLATKADLRELELRLEARFAQLEARRSSGRSPTSRSA